MEKILELINRIMQKIRYRNSIIDYKPIIDSCHFQSITENIYNGGNRIGIVLPHLVKASGGVTSILRLGTNLENLGYEVSYISMFNDSQQDMMSAAKYNLNNYKGRCIAMNQTTLDDFDVIIATEWRTVYRAANYNAYKMYFVQDFEPIFFEIGERYLLAKKTYEIGFHIVSLGSWNLEAIKKNCNNYGKLDYIEFPYEKKEYSLVKRNFGKMRQNKYIKIAVYVKEEAKRLPVIIPLILDKLKKEMKDRGYVLEINYFGNGMPICIPNGNELGKLTKEQLYQLYSDCDFGMVASLTNISLVPYEMIATGLPVIEFKDGTFDYFFDSKSAILCDLDYMKLCNDILHYVENPSELESMTIKANESINSLSWEKSAQQFDDILIKCKETVQ